MSMTHVNAKIYVSRILGGSANQDILAMANEAILRAYQDWETKKFWRFLLKDTSNGFTISGVTLTPGGASVLAPTSGAFDGLNVGVTVTTTGTATLAAGTTVLTIIRGVDGTITSITLSNTINGALNINATLTISGNIPVIAGTRDYNLPTDFGAPFTAILLTNPRTLTWQDQRKWDRILGDQTVQGTPEEYTTYNNYSELTQNFGTAILRFDRIPSAADTLLLKYYRSFITTGTYVDIPDAYLYKFLDYASALLLARKKAQEDPTGYLSQNLDSFEQVAENDEEPTDDNDADMCMKSSIEMGNYNRILWSNGNFDPTR